MLSLASTIRHHEIEDS